ncbi:MAG: class I SAM-dependent methyltransferase [Anaerolineales bacterium]|nr:class I SAM-dependent methyltransferase [Anaerolineales bacterium]
MKPQTTPDPTEWQELLSAALAARSSELSGWPGGALRLFNGFLEGWPALSVELFARTLVFYDYAQPPISNALMLQIQNFYREQIPFIECVLLKARHAAQKPGRVIFGSQPAMHISENGVQYALNLQLNQDAGFYLDTRLLREWLTANAADQTILNTFAYTGSLGVAAKAGRAERVIHTDLHKNFLGLAKESYRLNGWPVEAADFIAGDFFSVAARLNRSGRLFEGVLLDPPYFSSTAKGRVDLSESVRLINKVRPLITDGGWLVAVNNALFVSGVEYVRALETLCTDGYLALEHFISVPPDCTGYPATVRRTLPADPAPFNHSTKIAVFRVRRKQKVE